MSRIEYSKVRRSQRILAMVHELHKQGYQNLGIVPYMKSLDSCWCCAIAPLRNLRIDYGTLRLAGDDALVVTYSSSEDNLYFGWKDARRDTARDLAEKFAKRFRRIIEESQGANWEYAGWFTEVIGVSESGALPIALGASSELKGCLVTTKHVRLPIPSLPVKRQVPTGEMLVCYKPAPHLPDGANWHTAYADIVGRLIAGPISDAVELPAYPLLSWSHRQFDLLFEMGAYWEGALWFIDRVLKARDKVAVIDEVMTCRTCDLADEERRLFAAIWNSHSQLKWLRAHLVRNRAMRRHGSPVADWFEPQSLYRAAQTTGDEDLEWLAHFVGQHRHEGETYPNPYFGGTNPLHLGLGTSGAMYGV